MDAATFEVAYGVTVADFCECPDCGIIRLLGERVGEHHFAVRFGHITTGTSRMEVYLDGHPVADHGVECMAGLHGWVLTHSRGICPQSFVNNRHLCTRIEFGNVEVRGSAALSAAMKGGRE